MSFENDLIQMRQTLKKILENTVIAKPGTTVYLTYHDSDLTATPVNPTGDGTGGSWHTTYTVDTNWMSQKVGVNGKWSYPVPVIAGDDAVFYYIKPTNGTLIHNGVADVVNTTEVDYMEYATDGAAQSAYVSDDTGVSTEVDYIEYADDVTAQAAYVTNGNHAVTFVNNAQLDTAQKEFGTASLLLDGDDYLTLADHADWDLAGNDFTIDFQVRFNTLPADGYHAFLVNRWQVNKRSFGISISNTGGVYNIVFSWSTNGTDELYSVTSDAITISTGTWYHIAVVRDSNTIRFFHDGTAEGTGACSDTIYDPTDTLWIGAHGGPVADFYLDGWMDEIRISTGIARWTSGFTAPTEAYETDAYTKLLLHLDGSDTATSTLDSSRLDDYSEDTIKEQGSYSLKAIALITDSLNDTLTKTVSLDLSGEDSIKFDIRASRTGSNIKIGFHDSGGTTTEHTANVSSADTWQTETIDISGVSDANKDDIDSIIITVTNADALNTFYIDNIYSTDSDTFNLLAYSEGTIKQQGSYSLKAVALITDSLNDTLTKTVSLDLTLYDSITFDVRASRTGSNFKIGFHDSGGTTTEHTVNIASADTWQTETVDISAVADANKDDIDSIIITILNADAENTIYLDDIEAAYTTPGTGNLTIEARKVSGGTDTLLSTGTIKLYDPDDNLITVANGYATGSDGYTGVFDFDDIDSDIVITLKDGTEGDVLDTETLIDVTDGTDGTDGTEAPIMDGIEWLSEDPSAGKVSWSAGNVLLSGTEYAISAGNTTSSEKYIYWVEEAGTFSLTNTLGTAVASGRWLMCINDSGTAQPAFGQRLITAGLMQANSIVANNIVAQSITTEKLNGEAVTTAKITDNAATVDGAAYTASAISCAGGGTETTIQTLSITATGKQVFVHYMYNYADSQHKLRLYDGTTKIYDSGDFGAAGGVGIHVSGSFAYTFSAASHTITSRVYNGTGSSNDATARQLAVTEFKK